MRKLKLLMMACALLGSAVTAWAQTAPFLQEKSDFSGATVSSLTTFVPSGTTYTLELTGCTTGNTITVPGGSFSYTPTASGTVRFVRNGGDVVYVYENGTYKGTASVSTPEAPTYPTGLTSASAENLIQNGGFEDKSAGTYISGRWKPIYWTPYNKSKAAPDNGVSVREGSEMTGSYNMLMHNAGYYLTQQLSSGVMKNFTPYQISYKHKANDATQAGSKYKFQVGSAEFSTDYFNSTENNVGTTSVQTYTTTFTTPATVVDQPWIQLYRSTYAYGSAKQALDRFDEFILVAATGGGIGITGATGASFLTGTAYAPEGVIAAIVAEGPIDVTSCVTNPNFDTNISGWTSYTNSSSNKVANNKTDYTTNFWENWNSTAKEGRMFQVINNLPQGTYELQIYAFANQLGYMTPFSTAVAVYAQGQEVGTSSSDKVRPNYVNDINFAYYKSYAYVDETGKLEIGLRQYSPAQFGWLGIDNVTLKYISTDNQEEAKMLELYQAKWEAAKAILSDDNYSSVLGKERTDLITALSATVSAYADYKTVADAAHTACQTFMSAKEAYAACATEYSHYVELSGTATYESFISEDRTATDVLNAIKEAEYVAVTTTYDTDGSALFIASWDVTNFDALESQHWSGNASTYYDKWNGSSYNCSISKTVTLPQGHYAFYAAGRGQANSASAVTLKVAYDETTLTQSYTMKGDTGYGISTDGAANFSASGTYANGGAGRGWEWRYIVFDLDAETSVTLSIEGTGNNSWLSACDTKLLTYDNIAVTRQNYEAALAAAQAYQDDDMFTEDKAALNTVISDNTLTVATATQAELTTATANLNTAATKAAADVVRYTTYTTANTTINGGTNVDLTSLIGNPSFESTAAYALVAGGWVNEGVGIQGQTNDGFGSNRVGSVFAERWANNTSIGAFKTYQTIDALPAGLYEVSVVASFNGTGASLVVNGATTAITDAATYTILTQISDKGAIELGVQAVSPTGSWFMADNFTLKYVGADFPAYTLASGKMGTDKSAAQAAAETAFLENKTVDNYNALLTAITAAEASVANYEKLKAAINAANAVKDANNFVTAEATSTFASAIATANAAWTNVTYTDAEATAATASLGATAGSDRAGAAGQYMASTWGKTNENWNEAPYINTWSVEANTDGSGFYVPFFEYFIANTENLPEKTMTATLTGLENGCYDVTIWARVQRRSDADFNADNSMITMNVNGGEKVSIMSNTSNNVGTGGNTMRLGRYTARGMVTDGTLTLSIDVKLGANVHWLSWRDITYTKIADESVTVSDAGFATYVSTNALDFSKTTIKAYKVKVNENEKGKATLTQVEQVPANTPVLLYKKGGATEDIPVIASASAVSDNDLVAGTGATVATTDGDYTNMILNNGDYGIGFYYANGKTVATNRAYLHIASSLAPDPEDAGSRMVMVFADETTGISSLTPSPSPKGEGSVYTLSGQRVEKPAKGLYIVNGKKVVIK